MAVINAVSVAYNSSDVPTSGIDVQYQMVEAPPTSGIYSDLEKTAISGVGGAINFTVHPGAWYIFWIGRSNRMRHRIPDDAENGYELPPIVGHDSSDECITP